MQARELISGNKVITVFPVKQLVLLLLKNRRDELIKIVRGLRYEGFQGAVFFEILALLKSGVRKDFIRAAELSGQIRDADLYRIGGKIPSVPEASLIIEATNWVLNREIPGFRKQTLINPAKRVQYIALLNSAFENAVLMGSPDELLALKDASTGEAISNDDLTAFLIRYSTCRNDLNNAFLILDNETRKRQPLSPLITNAGHELFEKVPHKRRMELMVYGLEGSIRQFAVAPIEGAGAVVKEYLGATSVMQKFKHSEMSEVRTLAFKTSITSTKQKDKVMELAFERLYDAKIQKVILKAA